MAPSPEPPASITLRVKVPPGSLPNTLDGNASPDEFLLGAINVTANIGSIRQRIQQLLPSHPPPELQRLLYGGRALVDDEQSIADALNTRRDPTQSDYVVHMIVRAEGVNGGSGGTTATGLPRRRARTPNTTTQQPQQPQQPQLPQNQVPNLQGPPPAQAQQLHHPHTNPQMVHQMRMQLMAQGAGNGRGFVPNGQQVQQMPQFGGMPFHPGMQVPQPFNPNAGGGMPAQFANPQAHGGMPGQFFNPYAGGGMHPQMWHHMMAHQLQQQPQFYQQQHLQQHLQQQHLQQQHLQQQHLQQQHLQQQHLQQQHLQQQHLRQPGALSATQNMAAPNPSLPGQQAADATGTGSADAGESAITASEGLQESQDTNQNLPQQQLNAATNGAAAPQAQVGISSAAQSVPAGAPPATTQHRLHQRLAAMERSRRDLTEMRRNLEDLQNLPNLTPEQTRSIQESQERVDRLQNFIGPEMGRNPRPNLRRLSPVRIPDMDAEDPSPTQDSRSTAQSTQMQMQMRDGRNVLCYLLHSPEGPRALLFSPQFGTFAGSLPHTFRQTHDEQMAALRANSARASGQSPEQAADDAAARGQQRHDEVEAAVQREVQAAVAERAQAQAQLQAQGPLGPLEPLLGHVWLLMRILIFAYFLLGSNMGWQRPLILLAIGLGFWILRMGFLGEGAPLRRWWDGLVQVPQRDRAAGQQQPQQEEQQQGQEQQQREEGAAADRQDQQNGVAGANGQAAQRGNYQPPSMARRAQIMPTPEQVAQRLLDEDAARRRGRGNWLREQLRPVERGVALFVASLWPGVGEAHVRAQEREQRRIEEEEMERERREAAAAAAREAEEEAKEKPEAASGDEAKAGDSNAVARDDQPSGEGTAGTAEASAQQSPNDS